MKAYKELVRNSIKLSSGQILDGVHSEVECTGETCPVHKPSGHHLLSEPLIYNRQSHAFLRVLGDTIYDLEIDPDDYKYNSGLEVIVRNSATCLECEKSLISTHDVSYCSCHCGNLTICGGFSHRKRMFCLPDSYCDTSIFFKKRCGIYIYPNIDATSL